jgi:streptogramin lyase
VPGRINIVVDERGVWVGDEDGVIRRVDEDTRQVTEIPFGAEVRAIAFDGDADPRLDVA